MNLLRPKKAISAATFRDRFREQVLIISNLSKGRGRPKKSLLGEVRKPISRSDGAEIATALIVELESIGEILEPAAQELYDARRRAEWAAKQLDQMASTNRDATDADPFALVSKMFGLLLTIGFKVSPVTRRREALRVATVGAAPMEQRIAADRQWNKGRNENRKSERSADALRVVADLSLPGESFEEAQARHYEAIRNGNPNGIARSK